MINLIASIYEIDDIVKYKEAGAHSIIMGLPFFSARPVSTFSEEDIKLAREITLRQDMNLYVLMNRMFCEEELKQTKEMLVFLKAVGVDGIYFGDEALLYMANELDMTSKLIYNPDTLITNSMDVSYYLNEGISMVCISKEITLADMIEIGRHNENQVEVTIHGRLNMMHSKRKLLTNYFNHLGIDYEVNAKRTLSLKEVTRKDLMPIIEDDLGTHVFSGFTLVAFEEVNKLVENGIINLKIEGLFHNASYVIEALNLYQGILSGKEDAHQIYLDYQKEYFKDHIDTGFFYQKTSLIKEEL
ncbi:MAG: peptidase U32 family protein [Erysipelotrichaceae bacterium]